MASSLFNTFSCREVYSTHIAGKASSEDALAPGPSFQEELEEDAILPAPAEPKIKDAVRSEHRDFLLRAKILKDQGFQEQEIVRQLNEELRKRLGEASVVVLLLISFNYYFYDYC